MPGTPFREVLVKADVPEAEETADLINDLILKSQVLLANHPVNKSVLQRGKIRRTAFGRGRQVIARQCLHWRSGLA